ncbi:hypothetical protein D3C87_1573530 [compost metagenome]
MRAFLDLDGITRAVADQQHVQVPRGDQHLAGQHQVAILGFLDADSAAHVETARKGRGELFRHVLDDQNWRAGRGQGLKYFAQRLGAAGRGADGDQWLGDRQPRDQTGAAGVGNGRQDGIGRQLGLDLDVGAGRPQGRGCLGQSAQLGMGGGLGGVADTHARFLQELGRIDAGLGDDVDCAGFERLHEGVGPVLGQT